MGRTDYQRSTQAVAPITRAVDHKKIGGAGFAADGARFDVNVGAAVDANVLS